MLPEVLGLFAVLAVLSVIGCGPALWLAGKDTSSAGNALALAPALGYAIIGVIGFPLVRYVAPVMVWGWPITLGLLSGSAGLAVLYWRRGAFKRADLRPWALVLLGVTVGTAMLARPLLQDGIQYAVYRSNPSDAFLYTSLAETLHSVRWSTLINGATLSQSNWLGLQDLAAASPTALFTARFIGVPLAVNKMALMAWAAVVAGAPVYRFYYAHHLLAFTVALPAILFLGQQLHLPLVTRWAAAGAVAMGYWAHFLLEADAGYEISALPLLALTIAGWVLVEQAPERLWIGGRVMLALAVTGLIMFYFPMLAGLGVAGALYYGLGLAQRVTTWRAVLAHGLTAGIVIGLLAFTGQLDFAARNILNLIGRADAERVFDPVVLNALRRDGIGGLWGFSASALAAALPGRLRWPLENGFDLIGALLTVAWLIGIVFTLRRSAPRPERIVSATFLGGALFGAALLMLRDNERTAGKALTYVYPYLLLGAAISVNYWGAVLRPRWQRLGQAIVTLALALQAALGLVWPYRALIPVNPPLTPKLWTYDLEPIEAYLAEHPPHQLLVSAPRNESRPYPDDWAFAFYSIFAFSHWEAYFMSGVVIDNFVTTPNLWLQAPFAEPDYAVVQKQNDFIGPNGLGVAVAETTDLVLYQLTGPVMAELLAEEQRLQTIEATKGSLAP